MFKPIVQDKLLFPEILWQRPMNIYRRKGRVLILGGEIEIKKTLTFCEFLFYTQIQKISLGYPDVLSETYQNILPKECHLPLPSTPSKTLSVLGYEKIKEEIRNYDLLVIGIGVSQNEETKKLVRKLLRLSSPILLNQEGILKINPEEIKREHPTIYFSDSRTAAHLLAEKINIINENPLPNLEKLSKKLDNVLLLTNQRVFVTRKTETVVTEFQPKEEPLLATVAAFWAENLKKPFESAAVAAFITKTWQENFSKIADLKKAIDKNDF